MRCPARIVFLGLIKHACPHVRTQVGGLHSAPRTGFEAALDHTFANGPQELVVLLLQHSARQPEEHSVLVREGEREGGGRRAGGGLRACRARVVCSCRIRYSTRTTESIARYAVPHRSAQAQAAAASAPVTAQAAKPAWGGCTGRRTATRRRR